MAKQNIAAQLAALRGEQESAQQKAQGTQGELDARVETLKKLVKEGKATTGNYVDDYLLVQGVTNGTRAGARLHDLAGRLVGKQGQLVLLSLIKRERHVFGGPGRRMTDDDFHDEETLTMGVLGTEAQAGMLKFEGFNVLLHARAYTRVWPEDELHSGPMNLGYAYNFLDVERLRATGDFAFYGRERISVVVGDKEVLSAPCPDLFGYGRNNAGWIVQRNAAARLLGKDLPEAPEETHHRAVERDQLLATLNERRDEYRARSRNGAWVPPKAGDGYMTFGPPRGERNEHWDRLVKPLEYAKKIGLADHPLVRLIEHEVDQALAAKKSEAVPAK